MRVYSIAFRNKLLDVYTNACHTVRIDDEIVTFRFGVAETTNENLASFIKNNMNRHFVVSFEDLLADKEVEAVVEEPVVVPSVETKRRRRRRVK